MRPRTLEESFSIRDRACSMVVMEGILVGIRLAELSLVYFDIFIEGEKKREVVGGNEKREVRT